jgi:hypothetical protein
MPSQAFQNSYNFQVQNGQRLRDNMLARQAGGMMADGDAEGARNALYRGGQLEAGGQIATRLNEDRKRDAEFAGNFATGIAKRVQSGMDPEAAWKEAEQWATMQGKADKLPGLRRNYEEMGPQAFTAWLGSAAARQLQVVPRGAGGYDIVDLSNGGGVVRSVEPNPAQAARVPFGWELDENGQPRPIDTFVKGKARLAGATRAPRRGGGGGGGRSSGGARRQPWND